MLVLIAKGDYRLSRRSCVKRVVKARFLRRVIIERWPIDPAMRSGRHDQVTGSQKVYRIVTVDNKVDRHGIASAKTG